MPSSTTSCVGKSQLRRSSLLRSVPDPANRQPLCSHSLISEFRIISPPISQNAKERRISQTEQTVQILHPGDSAAIMQRGIESVTLADRDTGGAWRITLVPALATILLCVLASSALAWQSQRYSITTVAGGGPAPGPATGFRTPDQIASTSAYFRQILGLSLDSRDLCTLPTDFVFVELALTGF